MLLERQGVGRVAIWRRQEKSPVVAVLGPSLRPAIVAFVVAFIRVIVFILPCSSILLRLPASVLINSPFDTADSENFQFAVEYLTMCVRKFPYNRGRGTYLFSDILLI